MRKQNTPESVHKYTEEIVTKFVDAVVEEEINLRKYNKPLGADFWNTLYEEMKELRRKSLIARGAYYV